ncbi:MAG: 2-succinylbenzoate--CoA ligase [Chloroflexaceae bacterium]|nr:2-succinylbenzoate--CoA ligase [Chloroflexaceae bacterium]
MQTNVDAILRELQRRSQENWLIGYDSRAFARLVQERLSQLQEIGCQINVKVPLKVLLCESEPLQFLAGFLGAVIERSQVFLGNPHWKSQEWQQVFQQVKPDIIWGRSGLLAENGKIDQLTSEEIAPAEALIMIPTGGSSGKIRFAMHSWHSLTASVQGFYHYFGQRTVNSCCLLPLYHVSGLMQFLRSFLTEGRLLLYDYAAIKSGKFPQINLSEYFISLVPTQLSFLMENYLDWLKQPSTILIGGGPVWPGLLAKARAANLPLALTYGMTETASQVVTLKPADFLAGNNTSGQVLPHARVSIISENQGFRNQQRIGEIMIQSTSLCHGYYPQSFPSSQFLSDDLGYFKNGYLTIVGRSSHKIVTGGENVYPGEVEATILATGLVKDTAVIGVGDSLWGQAITAFIVPESVQPAIADLKAALSEELVYYKHPKQWIALKALPRNQQGKINYQELQEIALRDATRY